MSFNDYRSRFTTKDSVKVGDVVYWDTNRRWGRKYDNGTVTRVTKTMVVVYDGHQELKFRWSNANNMYRCPQEFNDALDMITEATAKAIEERESRRDAEIHIQNQIRKAVSELDARVVSQEKLEAGIAALQAQLEAMKALQS